MFEWTGKKLETSEALSKFPQSNPSFPYTIVDPADGQIRARLRDADAEAGDIQQVPDPLGLDSARHLVPREGRTDDSEDEHEHDQGFQVLHQGCREAHQ